MRNEKRRHTLLRPVSVCLAIAGGILLCAVSRAEENPSRAVLVAQRAAETNDADSSAVKAPPEAPAAPGKAAHLKAVRPSAAMYHSLWLSGWGQLDNGRKRKAALFIAAEAFFIGGFIYEQHLLNESGGNKFEQNRIRTDRNTFVIYWLGAKLFGMVDAYVDAQLRNYDVGDVTPTDLKRDE